MGAHRRPLPIGKFAVWMELLDDYRFWLWLFGMATLLLIYYWLYMRH
jgi:hypothetical protein